MSKPVNVYADAFGNYHADIELTDGDTTPDSELKSLARKAIRTRFADEIGKGYKLNLRYAGMSRSITRPGVLFVTFAEV